MKNTIATYLMAAFTFLACAATLFDAQTQSDASVLSGLLALPVASVLVVGGAVAGSMVAVPVVLSTAGAVLVVKTVESTARGAVYLLERASDGVGASIKIVGRGVGAASMVVGASVTVGVIGAGVLLSAAGKAVAFIPNALGRALLHNERLTP